MSDYEDSLRNVLKTYLFKYDRVKIKDTKNKEIEISRLSTEDLEWTIEQIQLLLNKFDLSVDFISVFLCPIDSNLHLRVIDARGLFKDLTTKK